MILTELTQGDFLEYKMIRDKFSYDGAMALYEYIDEYCDNDWAAVLQALIEWSEYPSKDEAVSDLDYSNWEELDEQRGTYEFDGGVLVCDY